MQAEVAAAHRRIVDAIAARDEATAAAQMKVVIAYGRRRILDAMDDGSVQPDPDVASAGTGPDPAATG